MNILVVGAGIGGLATALRLAKRGHTVTILEKHFQPGGRLNRLQKDGFTFDTGPSFFSMSYEFDAFIRDCRIRCPFTIEPLDPLYSVYLPRRTEPFHVFKNIGKFSHQFERYEPHIQDQISTYLAKCADLYNDTVEKVVKRNFSSVLDYLYTLLTINPVHLPILFRTFWQQVCRYISLDEARQIISLVAFFLGRTPFDTSAVYTLLSYVEFVYDGYYNVRGGMYRIVEGLIQELRKENVRIEVNTEIVGVEKEDRRITALIDSHNTRWEADIFVINADAAAFRGCVLNHRAYNEHRLRTFKWTMGYLTLYIGIDRKLPMLNHHNYFLGENYHSYAQSVLFDGHVLEQPYYYVNIPSKFNSECAPSGCEALFIVCPVPNLLYKPNWEDREMIVQRILADLSKRIGFDIHPHIVSKTVFTPFEWQQYFNLYKGSGLGLAHTMDQIGAFRPPNRDEYFANIFYVGASTVPGAGIPMALISSKLTCERIRHTQGDLQWND
ncbi:MAG: phytoene desaturase family protein [Bacteroidetes bacterium]|nr:phytoene desaturase family protein [Bacteroidota bacterium]